MCPSHMGHYDLHLHLNGSISKAFLYEEARLQGLEALYNEYLDSLAHNNDPWEKFSLIHKLMKKADLRKALLDVVEQAYDNGVNYLEIRSSVKGNTKPERDSYINSFREGLDKAKNLFPHVVSKGLLSVDRSSCDIHLALELLETLKTEKKKLNPHFVGLDIAGNFTGPVNKRAIYGKDLIKLISKATEEKVPLAIHLAERSFDDDTQEVLDFFKNLHNLSYSYSKVRFGHCTHLSKDQLEIIRSLNIPVEICPSMHLLLHWWKKEEKHPCFSLENLVLGTDDTSITGKNHRVEREIFFSHWNISEEKLKEMSRQAAFF